MDPFNINQPGQDTNVRSQSQLDFRDGFGN